MELDLAPAMNPDNSCMNTRQPRAERSCGGLLLSSSVLMVNNISLAHLSREGRGKIPDHSSLHRFGRGCVRL